MYFLLGGVSGEMRAIYESILGVQYHGLSLDTLKRVGLACAVPASGSSCLIPRAKNSECGGRLRHDGRVIVNDW